MRARSWLLPFLFGLFLTPILAQDRPLFRAGVDLVRLDVRVTDAKGLPIADLRPDEVTVIDGNETHPALLLEHIAESGHSYVESAERTVASEVSTNQGAPRGELYVLLFDQQHMTPGTEVPVRAAAEKFIRTHVRQEDRVAVYGLPAPGPALAFTSNIQAAIAQLPSVHGSLDRVPAGLAGDMTADEAYQIVAGNDAIIDRFMQVDNNNLTSPTAARTTGLIDVVNGRGGEQDPTMARRLILENAQIEVERLDQETRTFLQMTAQLLRSLRSVDGRKTVVLFSEGFHGDNVSAELRDVAAAAADVRAVIDGFDLNRRLDLTGDTPTGNDTALDINNRLGPIGNLASETNGELVVDAYDRLDDSLDALSAANNDYYIVGFAPSTDPGIENYRHVQVRVSRPGAIVKARSGYATDSTTRTTGAHDAIDRALAAPFTEQGLRVEYTTYVSRSDVRGTERVVLSLDAQLPIRGNNSTDAADVVFVVRDTRDGHAAASGSDHIPLPVSADAGSTTGENSWHVQFALAPGPYIMRCVVREPGGSIGSADRQFSVPALDGPDVSASDLILASPGNMLPVRTHAFTDAPLAGSVRVYGHSAAQLAGITATLALISPDADTPAMSVNGVVGDTRAMGLDVFRDVTFELPLARVAAGDYVARAVLRTEGETFADRRREVDVDLGAAPVSASTAASAAITPQPRDVLSGAAAQQLIAGVNAADDGSLRRAIEYARNGRWADVATSLVNVPASNLEAARLRGLAFIGEERYADAAQLLTSLSTHGSDDAALAFVLGWARVGAGDRTGAAAAFRSAAAIEPTMVPAYLALADAYLSLDQPAQAVQALEGGLAKLPDSVELKKKLESIKR